MNLWVQSQVVTKHLPDDDWVSGRELRDLLNEGLSWWRRWSAPAFYLFMMKLEDEGIVRVKIQERKVAGETVRVRMYAKPSAASDGR